MAKTTLTLKVLLTYLVISTSALATGTLEDIKNMKRRLFENYNKQMRPVYNLSDAVEIDTLFSLVSILDFDEWTGTIRISTGLSMTWYDFRLKWEPSEFGGITQHGFSSSLVWKPTIFTLSTADEYQDYGSTKFDVRIASNGQIRFSPGKILKVICTVDMTSFPSDSHVCSTKIMPPYAPTEVKLSSDMFMGYFTPSKEWEVVRTCVEEEIQYRPHVTVIGHHIYLTRNPRYFMISLISPIILLCVLNPFVFLLPVSSGERISFAVTIFLSLAVYVSYIGQELLPKVSDPMSGASYSLVIAMTYSCLLNILTILRLRCVDIKKVKDFPCWLNGFVKLSMFTRKCRKTNKVRAKESCSSKDEIARISRFIDRSLFCITEAVIFIIAFTVIQMFEIETGV